MAGDYNEIITIIIMYVWRTIIRAKAQMQLHQKNWKYRNLFLYVYMDMPNTYILQCNWRRSCCCSENIRRCRWRSGEVKGTNEDDKMHFYSKSLVSGSFIAFSMLLLFFIIIIETHHQPSRVYEFTCYWY